DRDVASGTASDTAGNTYVVGGSCSTDFPIQGGFESNLRDQCAATITKVDPTGQSLVFSTYFGGTTPASLVTAGLAVAVDVSGKVYFTGQTSTPDLPIVRAFQPAYGGGDVDGFFAVLSADGSGLLYSTYIGGSGFEEF